MSPLVAYHEGCLDGLAGAWAFWSDPDFVGAEFLPCKYGDEADLERFRDREVFFVDFSFPWSIMEEICNVSIKVYVLDHHKTTIESLKEHPRLDNWCSTENSGCMLAWEWLYGTEAPPLFKHIEDRDLWKFEMEDTATIIAAVHSYAPKDLQQFDHIFKIPIPILIAEGAVLKRKHDISIEYLKKYCRMSYTLGGYTVPVFNVPKEYVSDLCNSVCKEDSGIPFCAAYHDIEGARIFSLRSIGDFDVSQIAKMYGGGGHKNAAGFTLKYTTAI
jgi:oligoribonuclease NrnB/cAMP/cGMP phosphodiesterase (DHH superfamily)